MKYIDLDLRFALQLREGAASELKIYAKSDVAGESSVAGSLADFEFDLEQDVDIDPNENLPVYPAPKVRRVGGELFEQCFRGDIHSHYARCVERCNQQKDLGLRIRIHLDPQDDAYRRLAPLPWEWLYDAARQEWLASRRDHSIIRYLDFPRPIDPISPPKTLRILGIAYNPGDMDRLDLAQEWRHIETAFSEVPDVEFECLDAPTVHDLRQSVLAREPHVLHLMGHAEVRDDRAVVFFPALASQDSTHPRTIEIEAEVLTSYLKDQRDLRLVVLNACGTGSILTDSNSRAVAGLAATLAAGGIPAVVAMQEVISDNAAKVFSQVFYGRLAAGDPIDAALVEGRLSIRADDPLNEWWLPCLFMRTSGFAILRGQALRLPPLSKLVAKGFKHVERLLNGRGARLNSRDAQQSEFYRKYIRFIYHQRNEAHDLFSKFSRQREKPCFVVTGDAGKGKTTLLCHLTSSLAQYDDKLVPVLLSASDLRQGGDLSEAICRGLLADDDLVPFVELSRHITAQGGCLVVVIDGINELGGKEDFDEFSQQLDALMFEEQYRGRGLLVVLSCRSELWFSFKDRDWARNYIYRQSVVSAESASYKLVNFSEAEVDEVIEAYFHWYAIDGELRGSARQSCRDPIMLRYLCSAYTERGPNEKDKPPKEIETVRIGVLRTLRRKQAFDTFVEKRRRAMVKAAEFTELNTSDSRAIENLTTKYLITLAYAMYQKKRNYLQLDEVIEVARSLHHRDAKLAEYSRDDFRFSSRSIFFQLINEGIILNPINRDTFTFTFESYFEYSIGRYLALVHWQDLRMREGVDGVKEHFNQLMQEHNTYSAGHFYNLYGALQFAILVLEQEDSALAFELLECMTQESRNRFDWLQQACATIRETHLAQATSWQGKQATDIESLEATLATALEILGRMASKSEFVLMWDLERTLSVLASAHAEPVLERLYAWASEEEGSLRPFFGIQTLSRLGWIDSERVAQLLLKLSRLPAYRRDFWLGRVWIFAARSLFEIDSDLPGDLRESLYQVVADLADEAPCAAMQGVALSNLPFLQDSLEQRHQILRSARRECRYWPWGLWNLAFELRHWDVSKDPQWYWALLTQLAKVENHHLRYALAGTLACQKDRPKAIHRLEARLGNNRWLPGRHDLPFEEDDDRLGIVYSPAYLEPAYDNHVECRERLQALVSSLENFAEGRFQWITPRRATEAELELVHRESVDQHRDRSPWPHYIRDVIEAGKYLEQTAGGGVSGGPGVLTTGASELRFESYEIALLSAGGVIRATDYVVGSKARAAFAINRPPGHLANNTICIFNNIAIAARYAQRSHGAERCLILDFDAHHGHHTYRVFRKDPSVLYFSIHVDGEYAREAGLPKHDGEGSGKGYTFNINYPQGMSDEGYVYIVDQLLVPILLEFEPDMLFLSAGFDGHCQDRFTQGRLTEKAYMHLAKRLLEVAEELDINIVGTFEGGYALEGVSRSVIHMLNIFGRWGLEPESIGFSEPPPLSPMQGKKAMKNTRKVVRERVAIMAQVARTDPDYIFDLEEPHWQRLLQGATLGPDPGESPGEGSEDPGTVGVPPRGHYLGLCN